MDSKIIELAKKIAALSEKGHGGEKTNAQTKLNGLMRKYGITEEMLNESKEVDNYFNLPKSKIQFFKQVAASVLGSIKIYGTNRRGYWCLTCQSYEFIEIKAKYDFFSKAYAQDLEIFYAAFIQKKQIVQKAE